MARTLTKAVIKSLAVEKRCRAEGEVEDIRACLETPEGTLSDIQGSY